MLVFAVISALTLGCTDGVSEDQSKNVINAAEHGLSPYASGEDNSRILQALIDEASLDGKSVYIPAGSYQFAANGTQTVGAHCIKMRSGVSIIGDGENTVLMPIGYTSYGLDMFYFNDYLDTGSAVYLENCRFENFVIDALNTSCETYTSAGKGFMFNLFRNCHFKNITVKNTDATGFGVDCPIDSSVFGCSAIGCGKAAGVDSMGASGFGIGFGYSSEENIVISDCVSSDNKKFGFFFEHQGRFDGDKYSAEDFDGFTVKNCFSDGDLFGFGGINALCVDYSDCVSQNAKRFGFFFENSFSCQVNRGESTNAKEACFALDGADNMPESKKKIRFFECVGKACPIGVLIHDKGPDISAPILENCTFADVTLEYDVSEK